MTDQTRRLFLAGMAGLSATALMPGAASAEDIRLRAMWWGGTDRARRTNAVADLYSKSKPNVTIIGELANDYWPKLATQMAARNISDVFQLEPNSLSDYAGRGAALPIDTFIGKEIDVSNFDKRMVELCRARGKLYGIALGLNSFSLFYDQTVFDKAGLKPPTHETTWDEYARLSVELTKAVGRNEYWGGPYGGRYYYVFDVWLRQRGKALLLEEGKLGFTVDDAKEWFDYWETLRKAGGTISAEVASLDVNQIDRNALALGKAAIGFTFSNQLVAYQGLTKNKLGITMLPGAGKGKPSGHYYRPGLIWSVGATSKYPAEAAAYINFFVNDLEAGKVLGVERGVPMSLKVRAAVMPTLDETERASVEYINLLADKVSDYPPPAPVGSVEFDVAVMRKIADQIAFGKVSIADGAKTLVEEGNAVLRKPT